MHPRNPFRLKPPIFTELAKKYPELRSFCFIGLRGKLCFNFKTDTAIRCLSTVLAIEYFRLRIHFPAEFLVPRIPQRVNYLLLLQDLVESNGWRSEILGIDIGTGASCIYPLLGARLNERWRFIGTELNDKSIDYAVENVKCNQLETRITIFKSEFNSIFKDLFAQIDDISLVATFSMCNPPFFSDEECEERFDNINGAFQNILSGRSDEPRSSTMALGEELSTRGGEIEFVARLIYESWQFRHRIRIFTTMLGKKLSVEPLRGLLLGSAGPTDIKASSSAVYTLEQGRTHRWVLAWTFDDSIKLLSI